MTGDGDARRGLQVACWGRRFELGGGLLPAQIRSQGQALLASPVRVSASVGGKRLDAERATCRVTRKLPDVVAVQTTALLGQRLRATAITTFEFDGLSRVDLCLRASGTVPLDSLSVEVPLRAEQVPLYYRHGGRGRNSFGQAPPAACAWEFSPTLWFGSHERGLCWFAESPAGWRNTDPGKAIQWLPSGKVRVLKINLVDTPCRLAGTRTFTFGLLPTPCKRPPGKAQDHFVRGGPSDPRYTRVLYLNTHLQDDPLQYHLTPQQRQEARDLAASARGGQRAAAWMQLELVRSVPGYEEHFPEWQRVPGETYPPDFVYLCPQSVWSDLLLYGLAELQREYRLDGFYFDTGTLVACANRQHGCGCERGGSIEPTYPIFAIHEFKKRLYGVLVQRLGPDRAYLSSLVNGHMDLPCLTFDTAAVSGEEWSGQVKDDYGAAATPELLAVQYDPNLWGFRHVWLPSMAASHGRVATDSLLSLALLHNTPLWIAFCDEPRLNSVLDALATFRVRECRFLFPWDCRKLARLSESECDLAMHVARDRALLVVANRGATAVQVDLAGDWKAAGLEGPPARYEDALTHEVLGGARGGLVVPVGAKSFRLVGAYVGRQQGTVALEGKG